MQDSSEREVARLWRVQKTVFHMVHDRGYVVSQSELDTNLSEFISTYAHGGVIVE